MLQKGIFFSYAHGRPCVPGSSSATRGSDRLFLPYEVMVVRCGEIRTISAVGPTDRHFQQIIERRQRIVISRGAGASSGKCGKIRAWIQPYGVAIRSEGLWMGC
ncbi:hypothetical protein ABW21_db0209025 [Orbilia brochopaga]|nr:hypothetical protein ABW21_db0209025 [Drechslerella brochopaga]